MLQDLTNKLHGASMAHFHVHQSAKLTSGKIIRLKAPLHLPFCDIQIQGYNYYAQLMLFFKFKGSSLALASLLQKDTRKRHAQVTVAKLQPLRPTTKLVLLQLAQIMVQVPIVPDFSSQLADAFVINHFAV